MEALSVGLFLEAYDNPPGEIVLDLDATDDPLHGQARRPLLSGLLLPHRVLFLVGLPSDKLAG